MAAQKTVSRSHRPLAEELEKKGWKEKEGKRRATLISLPLAN